MRHKARFENFWDGTLCDGVTKAGSFTTYLEQVAVAGAPAGYLEIAALSSTLNMCVIVANVKTGTKHIFNETGVGTAVLGYDGGHFEYLSGPADSLKSSAEPADLPSLSSRGIPRGGNACGSRRHSRSLVFRTVTNGGEGDCVFLALAQGLAAAPVALSAADLRAAAVKHMRAKEGALGWDGRLSNGVTRSSSFDEYLLDVARPGARAGYLEIDALSRVMGVCVLVRHNATGIIHSFNSRATKTIALAFGDGHYELLEGPVRRLRPLALEVHLAAAPCPELTRGGAYGDEANRGGFSPDREPYSSGEIQAAEKQHWDTVDNDMLIATDQALILEDRIASDALAAAMDAEIEEVAAGMLHDREDLLEEHFAHSEEEVRRWRKAGGHGLLESMERGRYCAQAAGWVCSRCGAHNVERQCAVRWCRQSAPPALTESSTSALGTPASAASRAAGAAGTAIPAPGGTQFGGGGPVLSVLPGAVPASTGAAALDFALSSSSSALFLVPASRCAGNVASRPLGLEKLHILVLPGAADGSANRTLTSRWSPPGCRTFPV